MVFPLLKGFGQARTTPSTWLTETRTKLIDGNLGGYRAAPRSDDLMIWWSDFNNSQVPCNAKNPGSGIASMSKGRYGLKTFSEINPDTIQPPLDPFWQTCHKTIKVAVIDRFQGIRSLKSVAWKWNPWRIFSQCSNLKILPPSSCIFSASNCGSQRVDLIWAASDMYFSLLLWCVKYSDVVIFLEWPSLYCRHQTWKLENFLRKIEKGWIM